MQSNYFYCYETIENNSAAKELIAKLQGYAEQKETRVYLPSAPLEFRDSYKDSDYLAMHGLSMREEPAVVPGKVVRPSCARRAGCALQVQAQETQLLRR